MRVPLPGSGQGLSLFGCHLFQCDPFRLYRDGNIFCRCLVILGGFGGDGDVGLSRSPQGHESGAVYAGDFCVMGSVSQSSFSVSADVQRKGFAAMSFNEG